MVSAKVFFVFLIIMTGNIAAQLWQDCSPLPEAIVPAAVTVNGKIYAVGRGPNSADSVKTFEYDASSNRWYRKGSMKTIRDGFELVEIDGRIFSIGGFKSNYTLSASDVEEYDIPSGNWQTRCSLPAPLVGFGVAKYQGKLYIVGGQIKRTINNTTKDSSCNTLYVYNPANDTWQAKENMKTDRAFPVLANVDDKLLVMGGVSFNNNVIDIDNIEEYNFTTNSWIEKEKAAHISGLGQAAVLSGKIYAIFGGFILQYDITQDKWEEKTEIPAVMDFGKIVFNDQLYIIGGHPINAMGYSNKVIKYDPLINGYSLLPNVTQYVNGITEIDGVIYIIGGVNMNGTYVNKVKKLDTKAISPVEINSGNIEESIRLSQNYPNPFNPETVISYTIGKGQLSATSDVELKVFDILGKEVAVLVNEKQSPGSYNVIFNASGLSSGVYLYKLTAGQFVKTNKMILMR